MARVEAVLHKNPWLSILRQGVTRPDGSLGTHFTIHIPARPWAWWCAGGGGYLLIRQHRFIIDQLVWASIYRP